MKNNSTLTFFLLFFSICISAQPKAIVDTNKYRINLPDYWKPGNKVWKILDEKLPLVSAELKDKQLCGDNCKPKYTIEFEMSEPVVTDYLTNSISSTATTQTWEFVTLYYFSSSLLLFDEIDKLLTRFILVDENETWRVVNKSTLATFTPRSQQKIYALSGPLLTLSNAINRGSNAREQAGQPGTSPYQYINNNKDKLHPTRAHMLAVIDEKIRSW